MRRPNEDEPSGQAHGTSVTINISEYKVGYSIHKQPTGEETLNYLTLERNGQRCEFGDTSTTQPQTT